jgi:hypothetical protein
MQNIWLPDYPLTPASKFTRITTTPVIHSLDPIYRSLSYAFS